MGLLSYYKTSQTAYKKMLSNEHVQFIYFAWFHYLLNLVQERGMRSVEFECKDISKQVVLVLVSADQINLCHSQREEELKSVVDNLDATENGESSEETHRATNQTKC